MCNIVDTHAQTKIYRMIHNRNTTFLPCDKIIMATTYSEYYRMLSASTRPLCNPHRHQAVSLQLTTEAAEAWTIFSCFCGYGQNWTVWLLSRCFPILPGPQRSKRTLPRTPSPQTEKLQGLKASGLKAGKAQLSPSLFHFCTFLSNKYFWLNKGGGKVLSWAAGFSALSKLKQEDCWEFKDTLDHKVRSYLKNPAYLKFPFKMYAEGWSRAQH